MNKVKYLLTYRYSEIIHDLTIVFTKRYILSDLIERPVLPDNPQDAANFLLTLCHQVTYLLDKQIKSLEERFIKEGGFTENLFQRRLKTLNEKV